MSNQHSVHAGGAQLTGPSGQQPEQKSVLGFPVRPEGDGEAVAGSLMSDLARCPYTCPRRSKAP
ncbi:MAG: hypothetical protein QOG36_283 [Actinomycetota bacterium]|jgi:hypothetical protein|nr:hypothetical protein [Chloroflexota bacterium]MEA2503240.1 hypothetical protein [Actinomycetota bacterium]